ncbi:DNA repair protein rad52 [Terramyces sp. JEL0728]|nr:DNA repair protein rad52 [Terramyces sp. JEL0728]
MSKDELYSYCLNRIDNSLDELQKRDWIQPDVLVKLKQIFPPTTIGKKAINSESNQKYSASASTLNGTDASLKPSPSIEGKLNIYHTRNVRHTGDPSEIIQPVKTLDIPVKIEQKAPVRDKSLNEHRESLNPNLPSREKSETKSQPPVTSKPNQAPNLPSKSSKPSPSIPVQTKVGNVPVEISVDSAVAMSVAQKAVTSGAALQLAKGLKPKVGADGNIGFSVDPKSAAQAAKTMHGTGATKELIGGMSMKADVAGNQIPISGKSVVNETQQKGPAVAPKANPAPEGRSILEGLPPPPPWTFTKPKVPPGMPPPLHQTKLLSTHHTNAAPPSYTESLPPELPKRQVVRAIKDFSSSEDGDLTIRTGEDITVISSAEYVSERKGPNNVKLHYLEGWKLVSLANEQFGFNGWSSSIINQTVDFIDSVEGKYNVGISTIVRVTLKDGTFHEDVGFGSIENCKSKAGAIEKAKKESVTDALKRACKHFGNSLGNCLYNKEYLKRISRIGAPQARALDPNLLYRQKEHRVNNPGAPQKQSSVPLQKQSHANQTEPSKPTKPVAVPIPTPQPTVHQANAAAQPVPQPEKDEFMDSDDELYMNADLECINVSILDKVHNQKSANSFENTPSNDPEEFRPPNSLEFTPASKVIAQTKAQPYKLSNRTNYPKRNSDSYQNQQLKKSKVDEIPGFT